MSKALYIVIQSMGQWWVDFEGHAQGPYATREAAALEARNQAQFSAHLDRTSDVLVPDSNGKYWIIWSSSTAESGVPRSVSAAA